MHSRTNVSSLARQAHKDIESEANNIANHKTIATKVTAEQIERAIMAILNIFDDLLASDVLSKEEGDFTKEFLSILLETLHAVSGDDIPRSKR